MTATDSCHESLIIDFFEFFLIFSRSRGIETSRNRVIELSKPREIETSKIRKFDASKDRDFEKSPRQPPQAGKASSLRQAKQATSGRQSEPPQASKTRKTSNKQQY